MIRVVFEIPGERPELSPVMVTLLIDGNNEWTCFPDGHRVLNRCDYHSETTHEELYGLVAEMAEEWELC